MDDEDGFDENGVRGVWGGEGSDLWEGEMQMRNAPLENGGFEAGNTYKIEFISTR